MLDQGNASSYTYSKHYQFTKAYTECQTKKVLSFLKVNDAHTANFYSKYCFMKNIVTDQIFPENICKNIGNCEATSKEQYAKFINEHLQPNIAIKSFISCNAKIKDYIN